ncbi:hypothetical protein [Aerobium aerolatum]|uniref:Uncharacterized protein n=1 Tax=Aquamicrobium aerolatum DSM 21857 TaxID=1121003 RepID=A0A1I3SF61_9HYPH|nr:hypothetical protein [Aquamicrobium aerolatum]SFJ57378.1 hypothetical protein SAMN03080618_03355 [Aquamicrobium aerolatum DSM 21857]
MTRHDIEDEIERLLSILDALDGDPDREDDSTELDTPGFIWGGGEDGGPAHSGA